MGGEVHLPEVELVIIQYDPHRPDSPAVRDGYDRLTLALNLGFWLVDGEPVAEVKEPRVAFLYDLARERHALQAGMAAEEAALAAQKTAEAEEPREAETGETAVPAGVGEASRAAEESP